MNKSSAGNFVGWRHRRLLSTAQIAPDNIEPAYNQAWLSSLDWLTDGPLFYLPLTAVGRWSSVKAALLHQKAFRWNFWHLWICLPTSNLISLRSSYQNSCVLATTLMISPHLYCATAIVTATAPLFHWLPMHRIGIQIYQAWWDHDTFACIVVYFHITNALYSFFSLCIKLWWAQLAVFRFYGQCQLQLAYVCK